MRDALGSTIALTDSSGNKITGSDADYDPFGTLTNTPTVTSFNGYAGGYTPAAGGSMRLVHFGKRYYDPLIGRWTQPDPLDQAADLRQANRYLYVGQDPINLVDPTGMAGLMGACSKNSVNFSRSKCASAGGRVNTGLGVDHTTTAEKACLLAGLGLTIVPGGTAVRAALLKGTGVGLNLVCFEP